MQYYSKAKAFCKQRNIKICLLLYFAIFNSYLNYVCIAWVLTRFAQQKVSILQKEALRIMKLHSFSFFFFHSLLLQFPVSMLSFFLKKNLKMGEKKNLILCTGPVLESKGIFVIFQKRAKKGKKWEKGQNFILSYFYIYSRQVN